MEFKDLIAAFVTKYGIECLDNANGAVVLDLDGLRVDLLDDHPTRSLIACAEIGRPPPDANGSFGSMMLQANFLLRATEGATLCQNPETGAYAMVRSFPLALMDVETLASGIESLANHTENWRKVLVGINRAEDEALKQKGAQSEDSHHDMISSGYFHV